MKKFRAGEVRKSLKRFYDYAEDLINSDLNTFSDRLEFFVNFCTSDKVFSSIHDQILSTNSTDFDQWYKTTLSSGGSFAGSCNLSFPKSPDERISLMYQLIVNIVNRKISFDSFSLRVFATGSTKIDSFIYAFNDAVTTPLLRELGYKLEDLEESLPNDSDVEVPASTIQIIQNAQTVIQQSAFGNNITQKATIKNSEKIENLFTSLENEINSVITNPKEKSDALEIAHSAKEAMTSSSPKKSVVGALLNALPPLGNIASIASAILALL